MERGLDLECLIAMRECKSRSKIFKVKKIFNFFSKRVFSMFQDSGIILSEKKFFRLSDQSESRYGNEFMRRQRQKLPFTCNQRRQTLHVRNTWNKGTGPRVSHCDARAQVEVKNFLSQNKNCARFVGSQADATYFRPSIGLNPIYIIGHNYHGQIVADISFHIHNYSRSKSKGGNETS